MKPSIVEGQAGRRKPSRMEPQPIVTAAGGLRRITAEVIDA